MNETNYPGGPEMVKIDGPAIRAIREQKGLTQLYVATVVEVTTDTVSRWENRRYPSIKKDNALKLAAALEVELEAILDRDGGAVPPSVTPASSADRVDSPQEQSESETMAAEPQPPAPIEKAGGSRRLVGPVLIGCLALLVSAVALLLLFTGRSSDPVEAAITARRVLPPHFVAGQPFPIFLHLDSPSDREISIILREQVPPTMTVTTALPPISGQDRKDSSIKWLTKVSGATTFFYTLHSDPSFQGELRFDGILKVTNSNTPEITITGDRQAVSGLHHWADTDRDNRISDEEILAVYDLVGSDTQIGVDMELIEDIWLGDGYFWQTEDQRFNVLE